MITENEDALVAKLAARHSLSPAGVMAVLSALRAGGGSMAQFSHADFGGMSQWSSGMTMVGDMFNHGLKAKLNDVATELAAWLRDNPDQAAGAGSDVFSYRSGHAGGSNWWPGGLGSPSSVGTQNDIRYAVFPDARRLVIDDNGNAKVYDTGEHRIFGIGQAQGSSSTLSFTSQNGLVKVSELREVS